PWPRRSHMTPITLNRLERPQVEALITHRAGGKALPAEVVAHIVAKTDGVPLYVEELTKMLLDSSLLRAEGDQYLLTGPLSAVSIPDTLQLQAMRLSALQPVKGYASPELDAASARALTLCRSLGDRARLFPVLYARWGIQYVAGRYREGFTLSREYLEAARASGDDAALIVGLRIHAAGLFMQGEAEGARGLVREALPLYVPERHRPLITRFGQDLRAQNLIYFALSQALLGRIDEARTLGDEAIEHARSVDHVNTLAYTLFHCGVWLRAILRETDALRRHGAELLDLAREHRLGFWRAIATPFLLEGEEAERAVRTYRREFNGWLMVAQHLCHVADSYVATGRTGE